MEPRGAIRRGLKLAISLTAILVFSSNYFLLFTFVHCDHGSSKQFEPLDHHNNTATNHSPIGHKLKQADTTTPWIEQRYSLSSRLASRNKTKPTPDLDHGFVVERKKISQPEYEAIARIKSRVANVSSSSAQHLQEGQASASSELVFAQQPLRRPKRWARARTPRVQLAQRPPKSTTTTTSTSTTSTTSTTTAASTTLSAAEEEQDQEDSEESGAELGDDYVEIKQTKPATSTVKTTTAAETEQESEEGEEEEEEAEQTTTTTTTTTRRPPARKPSRKGRVKAKDKDQDGSQESAKKTTKTQAKVQDSKSQESSSKESIESKQMNMTTSNKPNETASSPIPKHHLRKKPLVSLPFIRPKDVSVCTPEAYLEFPRDFIGDKWRSRGLVIIHVLIVCYMFYSLALVCERYFMPSLEEFAQRLQISEDVAGATLMSAGSSAPELFTAVLGVFVAKGDVGTGAIVGSAVFNILFVIGVCAFVSSTSAQLQWWPVLRDSIYYTFTVLVLIMIIYDERITAYESGAMILLYGLYITIMCYNEQLKAYVTRCLLSYPITAKLISTNSMQIDGPDDVFGGGSCSTSSSLRQQQYELGQMKTVEDDSIFMAALLVIIKHKRLFRSTIRFQSAARYIIIKRQHRMQQQRDTTQEVNYFGPEETTNLNQQQQPGKHSAAQRAKMEAYARTTTLSKQKFSIVSKDDYEFWHRPPEEGENYLLWLARIPVNYLLHYTIPDCTLYPDKYVVTFVVSIIWTAVFSYMMVWMVTLIGYTLGIPDSVMGVTFLAAGTSVPDCYSSIHAARNGMADMAVSNSIGSNVFDILIGLSVPWFIQSAIYPGIVATINSRGVIYSVILLFLSLIVTIYLLNKYEWSLQPRLGLALLIAYGLFIILTCMLEFNLFGHVNPPPCPPPVGAP